MEIRHAIGGTLVRLGRAVPPGSLVRPRLQLSRLGASITPGTKPPAFPGYGPIGSYKPDADTTGVIAGSTLTRVDGTITARDGRTLENLDIYGRIIVAGTDVTIRNCRVRGDGNPLASMIQMTTAAVRRCLIEDTTVIPDNPLYGTAPRRGYDGVTGHDYTARRVRVENTIDGFGVFNTNNPSGDMAVTIEGCYVNDLIFISPSATNSDNKTHNDCLQIQGGGGITVRGCNFQGVVDQEIFDLGSFTKPMVGIWSNAVIQVTQGVGKVFNVLIENNWFDGGTFSLNLGGIYDNFGTIRNNRFGRNTREYTLNKGDSALLYNFASVVTLSNNVYDDEIPIVPRKGA